MDCKQPFTKLHSYGYPMGCRSRLLTDRHNGSSAYVISLLAVHAGCRTRVLPAPEVPRPSALCQHSQKNQHRQCEQVAKSCNSQDGDQVAY